MNVHEILDFDFSKLSQDELKEVAARALERIEDPEKGIGTELFNAIIRVVPQTCIEAIVVDNIDNPDRILVTPRHDEHYQGSHFPGGYIRFGDDYEQTVRKVINRELHVDVKRLEFTGVLTGGVDTRGHTLGTVFLVELAVNPIKGKWFDNVPEDMLPSHKEFLKRAIGWK